MLMMKVQHVRLAQLAQESFILIVKPVTNAIHSCYYEVSCNRLLLTLIVHRSYLKLSQANHMPEGLTARPTTLATSTVLPGNNP